jgi:hypothetical protein
MFIIFYSSPTTLHPQMCRNKNERITDKKGVFKTGLFDLKKVFQFQFHAMMII